MSTLKVNTVQHNTSGFNNVVQFTDGAGTQNGTLCRAWVNFNGTSTVAIRASFNVGSITDNGTGDYTVNFSNALSDANYSVSCTVGRGSRVITHHDQILSISSSAYRFTVADTTNSAVVGVSFTDTNYAFLTIFR